MRFYYLQRFLYGTLLFFGLFSAAYAQNSQLPPSDNFDLSAWKITLPDQSEVGELDLSDGFQRENAFYTDSITGAMVFRCPNNGATGGSSYPRCELREMLRAGDKSYSTKGIGRNNWVFSSSLESKQLLTGGVDGILKATVAVNYVSTTGNSSKVGRVIIGQIHASKNEPCRLYYRKLPGNTKGVIYFAHEPNTGSEQWYEMIGSRSSTASNPLDGIALGERFSYEIQVVGNALTVTIKRDGKADVRKTVDMSQSGYANDWMYFKAGVYNQNNTGDDGDYGQVSFYALSASHPEGVNKAPEVHIEAPLNEASIAAEENITIQALASDANDSVAKVEFYRGETKLGEDIAAPFSFTWNKVAAGDYVLSARATDSRGLSAISPSIHISVSAEVHSYHAPYEIPKFQAFMDECKLQAPVSTTIATTSELQAGYTSDWFYVAEADKMAFNQSGTSKRTELRYQNNWNLAEGNHSLHGRLKFVEQTCKQVTVVQIHDDAGVGSGPNKPLLRIYKHRDKSPVDHIWAAIKTDKTGANTKHYDLGLAPSGYFDWDVMLEDGFIIIRINGEEMVRKDVSYWTFPSYWKAGVYLQDEGEATVYFDALYHDNLGSIAVSDVNLSDIRVFPNPTASFITLDSEGNDLRNATVSLMDAQGKRIQLVSVLNATKHITLPDNKGLYVLEIRKGNSLRTVKIVKK